MKKLKRILRYCKYMLIGCRKANKKELEETIEKYRPSVRGKARVALRRKLYHASEVYGFRYNEYFLWRVDSMNHRAKLRTGRRKWRLLMERKLNKKGEVYGNKILTYELFKEYYHRDVIQVTSPADQGALDEVLKKHEKVIVKPAGGCAGHGVFMAKSAELIPGGVSGLLEKYPDGVLIEELIVQGEALARIHPSSVNTVRIHTLRTNKDGVDKVQIYLCAFRTGLGDSVVDNVGTGGLIYTIDEVTGIVSDTAFFPAGRTRHPDTGVQIVGLQIPEWDAVKALACEVAMKDPDNAFVAWDFAWTDKGWILVEGNQNGGFIQYLSNPFEMYEKLNRMLEA